MPTESKFQLTHLKASFTRILSKYVNLSPNLHEFNGYFKLTTERSQLLGLCIYMYGGRSERRFTCIEDQLYDIFLWEVMHGAQKLNNMVAVMSPTADSWGKPTYTQ